MKSYRSINEWSKDWSDDKQKLYNQTIERKYGIIGDSMMITDKELSEITGTVKLIIEVKQNGTN